MGVPNFEHMFSAFVFWLTLVITGPIIAITLLVLGHPFWLAMIVWALVVIIPTAIIYILEKVS